VEDQQLAECPATVECRDLDGPTDRQLWLGGNVHERAPTIIGRRVAGAYQAMIGRGHDAGPVRHLRANVPQRTNEIGGQVWPDNVLRAATGLWSNDDCAKTKQDLALKFVHE
jgi:hypothetical protein